jgi:hypothetical protein
MIRMENAGGDIRESKTIIEVITATALEIIYLAGSWAAHAENTGPVEADVARDLSRALTRPWFRSRPSDQPLAC